VYVGWVWTSEEEKRVFSAIHVGLWYHSSAFLERKAGNGGRDRRRSLARAKKYSNELECREFGRTKSEERKKQK
jgi:hypothetical protein